MRKTLSTFIITAYCLRIILAVISLSASLAMTAALPFRGVGAARADLFSDDLLVLPMEVLAEKGDTYFKREPMAADSAMACYYAATYRYLTEDRRKTTADHRTAARTLDNMSVVAFSAYADYSGAYSYLLQARKIAESNDLDDVAAMVTSDISVLLGTTARFRLDDDPMAVAEVNRYFIESVRLGAEAGKWYAALYGVFNMINFNFPDGREAVRKGIAEYRRLRDVPSLGGLRDYIGLVIEGTERYLERDYAHARESFSRAAQTGTGLAFDRKGAFSYEARWFAAHAALMLGDNAAYEKTLLERDAAIDTARNPEDRMITARELYHYYDRRGDSARATRHLVDFYQARDRLFAKSGVSGMPDFKLKAELDEIHLQMSDALRERERVKTTAIAVVGALLLLICFLAWAIAYYRKKQRLLMTLYEKNRELSEERRHAAEEKPVAPDTGAVAPETGEAGHVDAALVRKVREVLLESDAVFDPDFQMQKLCELVGSNSTYVSHAINAGLGKSFKTLVTERRVAEACRLLDDEKAAAAFTVESIGRQVGFNSRVTFTRAFKSVTGISPSEYRDAAQRYSRKNQRLT